MELRTRIAIFASATGVTFAFAGLCRLPADVADFYGASIPWAGDIGAVAAAVGMCLWIYLSFIVPEHPEDDAAPRSARDALIAVGFVAIAAILMGAGYSKYYRLIANLWFDAFLLAAPIGIWRAWRLWKAILDDWKSRQRRILG